MDAENSKPHSTTTTFSLLPGRSHPVADGHEDAASKGEMKLNLPLRVDGGASLSLLEKTELAENFRSLNHWQMRDIYTVPFDKDFSTKSTVPYDL